MLPAFAPLCNPLNRDCLLREVLNKAYVAQTVFLKYFSATQILRSVITGIRKELKWLEESGEYVEHRQLGLVAEDNIAAGEHSRQKRAS